jgi:hypothetical protein
MCFSHFLGSSVIFMYLCYWLNERFEALRGPSFVKKRRGEMGSGASPTAPSQPWPVCPSPTQRFWLPRPQVQVSSEQVSHVSFRVNTGARARGSRTWQRCRRPLTWNSGIHVNHSYPCSWWGLRMISFLEGFLKVGNGMSTLGIYLDRKNIFSSAISVFV